MAPGAPAASARAGARPTPARAARNGRCPIFSRLELHQPLDGLLRITSGSFDAQRQTHDEWTPPGAPPPSSRTIGPAARSRRPPAFAAPQP